jgi:hypothetical protein
MTFFSALGRGIGQRLSSSEVFAVAFTKDSLPALAKGPKIYSILTSAERAR